MRDWIDSETEEAADDLGAKAQPGSRGPAAPGATPGLGPRPAGSLQSPHPRGPAAAGPGHPPQLGRGPALDRIELAVVDPAPGRSRMADRETESAYQPVVSWLIIAICLFLAFPYNESTRNANELPRLVQGIALADRAELYVDGPSAHGIDLGPDLAQTVDGRVVPNKPPGTAPLAAAAFQLTRLAATMNFGPVSLRHYTFWARLLGGVIPALWLWAWATQSSRVGPHGAGVTREGHDKGRYLAATALILATPIFSYAHLFYGHVLAALCLAIGIRMMFAGVLASQLEGAYRGASGQAPRGAALGAWIGGLLAGLAVCIEYFAVFAAVPIAIELLILMWRNAGSRTPAIAAILGAILPIMGLAYYHDQMFASPLQTGYHHATEAAFAQAHSKGLLGLGVPSLSGAYNQLFALDTGLLVWAPLMLVALVGLGYGASVLPSLRSSDANARGDDFGATEARIWLGIAVIAMVAVTGLGFGGGWRVGPRYIVFALPAIAIGVAALCHRYREHGTVWFSVAAAAMFGVVPNALAGTLWPHLDPENIASPMPEVLVPLLLEGAQPFGALYSMGIAQGGYVCVGVPVLAMLVALVWAAPTQHKLITMLGSGAGVALLGLLWLAPAPAKSEANLRYIERVFEPAIGSAGTNTKTRSIVLEAGAPQEVDREPTLRGSGTW